MELQPKISQFLDDEGRITQLPRKQKPRLAVLLYLSEKFEPEQAYTEQQVNAICGQWHTFGDYFLLRRELVDHHLLCRERDGSRYWRPAIDPVQTQEVSSVDYESKAVHCVKDTVLPMQMRQFQECNCSLDEQYRKYGNTPWFFAEIIEPGRVYEIGYPKCVCPEVLSGAVSDPAHCECSRQSVLYILRTLLPDKTIAVETVGTVLGGAEKCRFRVTVA